MIALRRDSEADSLMYGKHTKKTAKWYLLEIWDQTAVQTKRNRIKRFKETKRLPGHELREGLS